MTLKHVSGWGTWTSSADQKGSADGSLKTSLINIKKSKLISSAITATAVILASNLKAKATEADGGEYPEIETSLLNTTSQTEFENSMGVDSVLGSVEVANFNSSIANSAQVGISINQNVGQIPSEAGLPNGAIVNSLGVSDPAQATSEFPSAVGSENAPRITNIAADASSSEQSFIRGPAGLDGNDGHEGATGRDGLNGIDGTDGINGQDGTNGEDGKNGRNGVDGADGRDGSSGRDGIDGQDGINGADGIDGRNGTDGQNGSDGTNGQNGRDGTNGQNGSDGTNGQNGIDGADGADGEDGKDGLTTLILDPEFFNSFDLPSILENLGIENFEAPNGSFVLALTPEQIIPLYETLSNLPSSDEEVEDNDHNSVSIEGSDQDDYIVATERGGTISGLGGNDQLVGNQQADILNGGDGNDTADYSNSEQGVTVNLSTNVGTGGDAEGDQYRSIENLVGSNSDDILIGDTLNNQFFGGTGIDTIFGDDGFDTIEGGDGGDQIDGGDGTTDVAQYLSSDAGVTISLLFDTAEGGHAQGDELDNIESLSGSLFDDFLQGDNTDNRLGGSHGEDQLFGEGGNDTLVGGGLGDLLDGGTGNDTADYTNSGEGVRVSLTDGTAFGGEAQGDTLVSIENLAGSLFDDFLQGDEGINRLTGRDGDDSLFGEAGNDRLVGGLGADHLNGGEGNRDAADYSAAFEAVGVDLVNGGFQGEAKGDTFDGIEFVVGSQFHDKIFGDDEINRLTGEDGCDVLQGRGGNDTLIGGLGNDTLNGGEGNDVFIFEGTTDNDIIEDFEAGLGRTDRVWLRDGDFADFEELQDALTQIDDGALLTHSGGEILFQNLAVTDFVADDFILA